MRKDALGLEDEIELDVDFDVDEDGPPEPEKAVFVFDPAGVREATIALRAVGMAAQTCQLGSELMAAANRGEVAGVVVAAEADEELRELFMRAFTSRFPDYPVLYLHPRAADPQLQAAVQAEGAKAVVSWPLPAPSQVLPTLSALFPAALGASKPEAGFDEMPDTPPLGTEALPGGAASPESGAAPLPLDALTPLPSTSSSPPVPDHPDQGASRVPEDEAAVLGRKLGDLEAAESQKEPSEQDLVNVAVFEAAVRRVHAKDAENTELRSELTIVRDHNAMLEDRVRRLKAEVEALSRERDSLMSGDEPSMPTQGYAELLHGVESYSWAMETATQFLEDLKQRVGSRAPSLDTHIRTLKLVKQLLDRLSHEAQGGSGEQEEAAQD